MSSQLEQLSDTPAWKAYARKPCGELLAELLKAAADRPRELLELLEAEFSSGGDWRTAQHLALCYAGRFSMTMRDLSRSGYFAARAFEVSNGDIRARLALARVYWERRLPLAVHHEVDAVLVGVEQEGRPPSDAMRRQGLGECAMLRGMSFAYMKDVARALAEFEKAEMAGTLTLEGVVQLLLVNEPDHLAAGDWAAARLRGAEEGLGGRAAGALLRVWRRRLVTMLGACTQRLGT
jgi:hypothetical protein